MPKAIFAAYCIFLRKQNHVVVMELLAILLNACIYKREPSKNIIGSLEPCFLFSLFIFSCRLLYQPTVSDRWFNRIAYNAPTPNC